MSQANNAATSVHFTRHQHLADGGSAGFDLPPGSIKEFQDAQRRLDKKLGIRPIGEPGIPRDQRAFHLWTKIRARKIISPVAITAILREPGMRAKFAAWDLQAQTVGRVPPPGVPEPQPSVGRVPPPVVPNP